ncbi:hypothetical protein [Providencia alcalifaciens]|uniref:phage tail fiber protein n=1 Tax=Providencia alcalifaciens TaxID=126385 RepID=UPI001CC6A3D4|nr:hypothetical protein [Providencia alcalifaciens]CAG9426339.1 hypothetical protein NVI2019_NGLDDFDA_02632 [Providencia alcalifaciens]
MIYQTGTITTTAGQTKIKGTGTRWKDNLAGISEGCPISYLINNTVFMNTVLSVNSDTEINLTYPVPVAASAAKYQIATFVLDSMSDGVRKMLANQQYIQYFLRNMDAWLTQDGIVEVKTPTGETVRLESLVELKKQMDNKLDKTGGTIAKNSDALNLRNTSENQALFLGFQKMDGKRRGYIGAPNDKDRISIVNDVAATALTLTEDGRLTFKGTDVATLAGISGTTSAAASWYAGNSSSGATYVKLCTIGNGASSSQGFRYQIFVNSTAPTGFSSAGTGTEAEQHFGTIVLTIGNGQNPNKNILGSYYCTSHFDIASSTIAPVLIKQVNTYKAEIWLRASPYSNYSCTMNTGAPFEASSNVKDASLVPVNNGVESSYYIPNVKVFALSNKNGHVESRDTLRVLSSSSYPRITLTRSDLSFVSLEADVLTAAGQGNRMAHLIHRKADNSNIAVIGFPNRSGVALLEGDFGLGNAGTPPIFPNVGNFSNMGCGFYGVSSDATGGLTGVNGSKGFHGGAILTRYSSGNENSELLLLANYGTDWLQIVRKGGAAYPVEHCSVYTTRNTTKDSNGNLKAASPIVKLFKDRVVPNEESEGVAMTKLGVGVYRIENVLGLNADPSWGGIHGGLVVPNGINNLPLVWADFDVLPDGDIIIETRYRKHILHPRLEAQRLMTYPEFLDENNVEREDYDYCDIPNGHWIDVRVNMPSDSIYNQKLAEAERLAKIEAERVEKEEAEKAAMKSELNTQYSEF